MLACFHPQTGRILLVLVPGLLLGLVFFRARGGRRRVGANRWRLLARDLSAGLGTVAIMVGLTLWLGSYSLSPLSFARQPALRGFIVQKAQGPSVQVQAGDGFSISRSSLAFITPLIEPGEASCIWQSQGGAMLDAPDICDIAYAPPAAEYDVLRLRVRSGCGLPDSLGNLRIAILP